MDNLILDFSNVVSNIVNNDEWYGRYYVINKEGQKEEVEITSDIEKITSKLLKNETITEPYKVIKLSPISVKSKIREHFFILPTNDWNYVFEELRMILNNYFAE